MSTDDAFLRFMSRNLVAFAGAYRSFENGQPLHTGMFVFSGCVIEIEGRAFWVTAGHCLKEYLDEPIARGDMQVFKTGFLDNFNDRATNSLRIPFEYESGCAIYMDRESLGLDFGLIPLDHLTVQNLRANGVEFIQRSNWRQQDQVQFEQYVIVGFPSHLQEDSVDSQGNVHGSGETVMVPIERVDPASIDNPRPETWFVGRIPDDCQIESVEGMSGGPIFGFARDSQGQLGYHVVAIQSAWRPGQRIVFGCSVPMVAEAIVETLREIDNQSESTDP